jgi:Arc/MetJ-type ribon-helix-helix transcriptional regulator
LSTDAAEATVGFCRQLTNGSNAVNGVNAVFAITLKGGPIMNLEIHKPELVQRVNAQIQSGHFHDADELIEKALDALEGKTSAPASAAERRRAAGRKSLVEVFAPLRGMNLDFSRNKSASRPVDLG